MFLFFDQTGRFFGQRQCSYETTNKVSGVSVQVSGYYALTPSHRKFNINSKLQKRRAGHRARQIRSARWPTLRCDMNKVSDIDQTGFFLARGRARVKLHLKRTAEYRTRNIE
ncbi:hypothetical protein D1AOALGA4SA_2924 [Olavius algarvensis Delta 1 endosymbiont]|nr:hypothetical protein D1AOALGA4SA_2924 [Olavius algarvensis Delta 1 endosymbiont]